MAENTLTHVHGAKPLLRTLCCYYYRVLEFSIDLCLVFSLQNGLNALHLAAKEGHKDLVEELLDRGAPVDSSTKVAEASNLLT